MSSQSSIENQTWKTIGSVNYRIQQQVVEQKQEQRRVENNLHISKKQQIEKDVLVPAALSGEGATSLKSKNTETQSPKLPYPNATGETSGESDKQEGLIAILGAVLALQAKCNSNFWSTLWKQTSESMMIQVKFAPIIGKATENAAQDQADGTRAQATQEKWDGMINLGMFGVAVVMAGALEYKNPEDDSVNTKTTGENEEAAARNGESTSAPELRQQQETQATIRETETSNKNTVKRAASNLMSKMKLQKALTGFMQKLSGTSMSMQMAAQGSTGLVNQHYLSEQANYQGAQGIQDALSKESEQFAQFYGQDFSRGTDLAQGSSQNIDFAMNILKSASDTITQTVTSMFRG